MSYRYKKRRYSDRSLISIISYFVRQLYFPNPFTNLIKDSSMAEAANWICGVIFVFLAYTLTGTWYDGDERVIGSIGFFINFAILTGLFLLITKFFPNYYLVASLFFIVYILLCLVEGKILGKKYSF